MTENVFPHLSCPAKLSHHSHTYSCIVLVDSRAEQSFLDERLAQKLGFPLIPFPQPLRMSAPIL